MFDPERLLKQVMKEALSGSLGGKQRRHKSSYGSSGLGGLLGGSSSGSGLGSLLGGALGGGGRSSGGSSGLSTATKAKLGLGALGLAIAAYEHYKSKSAGASSTGVPPPPAHAAPPPPPPGMASPPQAPAAAPVQKDAERAAEAMHLLRAMISAANADGLIDADERSRILGSARDAGLDADDLDTLEGELAAPLTVAQLVARTRPGQREPVYVASVIAIGRDTDLEVRYLDDLAQRLGLDAAARDALHAELGL